MRERLQKILAASGVASRRKAEELIREGRVRVNGKVISEMGFMADAAIDTIRVDGKRILTEGKKTILINKPRGMLTTMNDPRGRDSVAELVKGAKERLFPVGRLDRLSEGMLLMTNDGELAYLLTHPKHAVAKVYHVEIDREASEGDLDQLRKGIVLDDGITLPTELTPLYQKMGFWYKMTIKEGRNRQIRRMFAFLGYEVIHLRRVQIGRLMLGNLRPGEQRELTRLELIRLRSEASGEAITRPRRILKGGDRAKRKSGTIRGTKNDAIARFKKDSDRHRRRSRRDDGSSGSS